MKSRITAIIVALLVVGSAIVLASGVDSGDCSTVRDYLYCQHSTYPDDEDVVIGTMQIGTDDYIVMCVDHLGTYERIGYEKIDGQDGLKIQGSSYGENIKIVTGYYSANCDFGSFTSYFDGATDIYGASGDDIIEGSAYDDNIYGGYGDDKLYGLGGDDVLEGEQDTDDYCEGGAGSDDCDCETNDPGTCP